MGRKPPVIVSQTEYLRVIKELHKAGEEWILMADLAEYLNVTQSTARRKLDGLVHQNILEVHAGYGRCYRLHDYADVGDGSKVCLDCKHHVRD